MLSPCGINIYFFFGGEGEGEGQDSQKVINFDYFLLIFLHTTYVWGKHIKYLNFTFLVPPPFFPILSYVPVYAFHFSSTSQKHVFPSLHSLSSTARSGLT